MFSFLGLRWVVTAGVKLTMCVLMGLLVFFMLKPSYMFHSRDFNKRVEPVGVYWPATGRVICLNGQVFRENLIE